MEQLWRRIERIYDAKLQAIKEREEKEVEKMVARLRHEYKENLLIKQKQFDELAQRKDDEYRSKEDALREDIRLSFEKKKLEYERMWREIEVAQKEIQFRQQLLDDAQANFLSKKENELHRIDQERRTVERFKETLVSRERAVEKKLQEELKRVREQHRVHMAQMEEMAQYQEKLSQTELALKGANESKRKMDEHLKILQMQNDELLEENEELRKKLGRQETSISNLKKQLKLVEESAAIRINDLKFHHRLTVNKLQVADSQLRAYHMMELEKPNQSHDHRATSETRLPLADLESVSTSTPSESSFEQNFRDRMNAIELSKQVKLKIGVALVLWLTEMSVCIIVRK
ncbi:unnamed protein product [Gongylonema pulchrum]|uniref:Growth arrest-specific protein 8 n=1 Tax=Gongylonema pulchrum TaxID=637853 RepID=A0A183EK05_9BILA|nr:unnamed protein product [Gongylonema pulchrum]